jgi:hypothetical protein
LAARSRAGVQKASTAFVSGALRAGWTTTAGLVAWVLAWAEAPGVSQAPIMAAEHSAAGTVQRTTPDSGCLNA